MSLTPHPHHASRICHGRALADVPPALSLGENLNVQPVKPPLFVNAELGFMAVDLQADYDDLARKLILARHTGSRYANGC